MIKVFIVDDHEIIREGLKQILLDEKDLEIVGEASNGVELFQKIYNAESDVILMDLNLPEKNGNELIKELKKKRVKSRVLVLTISPEQRYALKSFKAGAAGFIDKSSAVDDLVAAIHSVYETGRYLSPSFAEQVAYDSLTSDVNDKTQLSYTELKFAMMLNEGFDVKNIAADLGLEHANAVAVKRKIFKKLNIKSYIDLVHYFDK